MLPPARPPPRPPRLPPRLVVLPLLPFLPLLVFARAILPSYFRRQPRPLLARPRLSHRRTSIPPRPISRRCEKRFPSGLGAMWSRLLMPPPICSNGASHRPDAHQYHTLGLDQTSRRAVYRSRGIAYTGPASSPRPRTTIDSPDAGQYDQQPRPPSPARFSDTRSTSDVTSNKSPWPSATGFRNLAAPILFVLALAIKNQRALRRAGFDSCLELQRTAE